MFFQRPNEHVEIHDNSVNIVDMDIVEVGSTNRINKSAAILSIALYMFNFKIQMLNG